MASNCPKIMSASENPMLARANTKAAWANVIPPKTGTLTKIA